MKIQFTWILLLSLWWISCSKNFPLPKSAKSQITIKSIGFKTPFIDFAFGNSANQLQMTAHNPYKNRVVSLNNQGTMANPIWQNILGGKVFIEYDALDPTAPLIKDSINLETLSTYTRLINNGTYTIRIETPQNAIPADTFIRFSAIDSGFVVNGNTDLAFSGVSRDGLITIADSLVQNGSTPYFTLTGGAGINLKPFYFGHSDSHYYLYISGNITGTLNLLTRSQQIGSTSLTIKTGYQYNVSINNHPLSKIEPVSISFLPFNNQTLVVNIYSGNPYVKTLLGLKTASYFNGAYTIASFSSPISAICSDSKGNIFFLDQHTNIIWKRDLNGITSQFTSTPNNGSMAIDKNDNLYLGNGRSILKIDPSGLISTFIPDPKNNLFTDIDGPPGKAQVQSPTALTFGPNGNLYFLENIYGQIRMADPNGNISTIHPNFPLPNLPGNQATNYARGELFFPWYLAVDAQNNIYVSELDNYQLPSEGAIYKISPSGNISLFAGSGNVGSMDGPAYAASFNNPGCMIFDPLGNLLVSDLGNNKIRKIDPNGNVTTYAGNGLSGNTDGLLNSSTLTPVSMTFTPNGNLYFSDITDFAIREIFIHY